MGNRAASAGFDPKVNVLLMVFEGKGLDFFEDIGNFRFCPTGEPYWTVLSEGVKPEGMGAKVFKSEEEAFGAWNKNVEHIIGSCAKSERLTQTKGELKSKLVVFWRVMPEMTFFKEDFDGLGDSERWTVYSRFRISSMPIIQAADYNEVYPTMVKDLPDIKRMEA